MARTKAQEKTESCTGATELAEESEITEQTTAEPEDAESENTEAEPEDAEAENTEEEPEDAEAENTEAEPEEKKNLIAVLPILFESHQYMPGDSIPTHNLEMLGLWLENGAAKWMSAEQINTMRARPASATAGLPGQAVPSGREDLAGRVPDRGSIGRM